MQKFLQLLFCVMLLFIGVANAQSVIDPTDPIVRYTGTLPAQPADGQVGKWISTDRHNDMPYGWHSDSLKAYIYKGLAFRVQFPKSYKKGVADGKKYPVFLFFHGKGEAGPIQDNEYQLYHGGYIFSNAVSAGTFDGFLLYPQSASGYWTTWEFSRVKEILDYMAANNKVDLNRIIDNGLSSGGGGTWDFMLTYPTYVASALPMSSAASGLMGVVDKYKFTPVWLFQGQLDGGPTEWDGTQLYNAINNAGGNIRYTLYQGVAHDTWYHAWAEPDFFPTMNRAHILTPWPLGGRSEFCDGDPINLTVGIARGFTNYQWSRNGVVIDTATGNQINVTSLGTYAVRVSRDSGTTWSEWSPTPLVIKIKAPTVTPPITTVGLASNVIPAPDGKTTVSLRLPQGYIQYKWMNAAGTVVSTDSVFTTSTSGAYTAIVTELYGCSSNPTAPFNIINASGPGAPDGIRALTATPVSKTQLRLDWIQKDNPQYNETFFEVYRGTASGGPYTLVAKVPADTTTYMDNGLVPNTYYYYVVRPVNNNAAGPVSAEVKGSTVADTNPPTAPTNLRVNGATRPTTIPIAWNASTDDVGIAGYDVYVNGVKTYTTDSATRNAVLFGLTANQQYSIYVIARDIAGNSSVPSAQISVTAKISGLRWDYYVMPSTISKLPDYGTLTPDLSGSSAGIDLGVAPSTVNYAMRWTGYIRIPKAGTYTFQTSSDDGSKFFFNIGYNYSGTATINNDGLHGSTQVSSSSMSLTAGIYPFTLVFFQAGGGQEMKLLWKSSAINIGSFTNIDSSYFIDSIPVGSVSAAPTNIGAVANGYKSVTINWKDNSTDETGFEVYRTSTQNSNNFSIVGRTAAAATSFTDNSVAPATPYYYRVAAVNVNGTSSQLNSYPLRAWYKLNGNAADSSYFGINGTASGVTWSADGVGGSQSASFTGATSSNVTIGNTTANGLLRDTISARTISMWIKPTAVSGKQYVLDIGNATNGMGIRLNGNKVEGAIAASGTRIFVTTSTQALTANNWVHVVLVYGKGGSNRLKLYVNNSLATSATGTNSGFTSNTIGAATENALLGTYSGTSATNNAFNDNSSITSFKGLIDNVMIFDQALVDTEVTALYNQTFRLNTTYTAPLPAAPAAPSQLTATNSGKNVKLTWKDNANNEDKFELYRSINNNSNFKFLATLDTVANSGGQGTYLDSSVFSNSTYYYQIRAVNITGPSAWSNTANATTPNNPPVIVPIASRTIRYDNPIQIPISASDPDGDQLSYSFRNMPAFITLVNGPNGPYLNVAVDSTQMGAYLNLAVIVTDTYGASDTTRFNLIVNSNYPPVLDSIAPVTLNEGGTQQLTLHATDKDAGDTYTWTGVNMPSFITLNGNGLNCTATIHPGFTDAGTYTVKVQITDNKGGTDYQTFNLVVNKVNPSGKIFLDVTNLGASPAPWNMTFLNAQNPNLKNDKGEVTSMGINFITPYMGIVAVGPTTGNNSGVVPDAVMKDYLYMGLFGIPDTIPVVFTGLDTVKQYNIRFYAGSVWDGNKPTDVTYFKAGNQLDSINEFNNTTKLANLTNLKANADGTITAYAYRPSWSSIGYISSVELDYFFDDGNAPAAPKNLTGQVVNDTAVLQWVDVAYNELKYQIFRSNDSITFTLLDTAPQDATSYSDTTALGNHKYYYKVRAYNDAGGSLFSNIISISLPNKKPVLANIADVKMKSLATQSVNVSATSDPGKQLTLAVAGLPSFGTFTDNGNGTGVLNFAPTADNTGSYTITITANDNFGGSSSKSFQLFVSDRNTTRTFFNMSADKPAPAPWNNIPGYPSVNNGIGIPNTPAVVDENNVANGMSLLLQTGWDGWTDYKGMNTGQNVGVYPDTVLYKGWYLNTGTQTIVIGGLDNTLRYNFVFFNSQSFGFDATTIFTINGNTVTSNAAYNIAKTVQVNNITPSNGQVTISISKSNSAVVARLNAIVVEAYSPTVAVMSPGSLRAIANDSKSVTLTWADRSYNETGFQIYRKTGSGGVDQLLTSPGANVTTFTDTNVQPNTQYIYHIRAAKGTTYSDFSATATTTTYALNVYVNFGETSVAPAPWNNTLKRPSLGNLISNLRDDNGNPTGIGINITQNFTGVYGLAGMNTGNNSGVYPDAVLAEDFVLFAGARASMKITGLSQGLAYNLTVFNSAADNNPADTRFIANGKQVTWLNANQNTKATATIYNVVPDQNGEIKLDVETGPQALFGLMGALVIQGYSPTLLPSIPGSLQTLNQNVVAYSPDAITKSAATNASDVFSNVTAFPNPFGEQININMTMKRSSTVYMEIFDLTGHLMYREMLSNVPEGSSTLRVYTGGKITVPGYYLIRLTDDQRKSTVIRAIKQ
ncbi:fibronectin type III domain-containing protein [Chitinophaga sp. Cy-1792]|uniref:fibronectin type III domain-containing protein n=1 Tax=Chitinophaga sp. Cy-1792 TaxID=2608339 RepID=UPI0014241187|nr:fibronectin type III domain-containing protein [Chitinophaga sp. Cy-1792]